MYYVNLLKVEKMGRNTNVSIIISGALSLFLFVDSVLVTQLSKFKLKKKSIKEKSCNSFLKYNYMKYKKRSNLGYKRL